MTAPLNIFTYHPKLLNKLSLVVKHQTAGSNPPTKEEQLTDETILIGLLRRKERIGYEKLYNAYASTLFGVIKKIVPDVPTAEDILSETFVKIISALDQYDASRGRFFTWMINIARNLCFDKLRSKEYRNSQKNTDIEEQPIELNNYSTSFNSEHCDLYKLTRRLDPNQKVLIDLAYFKGYTQTEIAKELNIPLGTVKTRLRMAINELRKVFQYLKVAQQVA